jgi:diketogulonate reductase-like aldo/keto reductase
MSPQPPPPVTPTAASAGSLTLGGALTVNRLGFGAMRLTGRGIFGPPADRDECRRGVRRAIDRGVTFIDTADSYGPAVSGEKHRGGDLALLDSIQVG